MPSNVEIKASVDNLERVKEKAAELSRSEGTLILQEDTFFSVDKGRLKLRKLQGQPSQLIHYERSDQTGPKFSDYHVTEIQDPDSLRETLSRAIGIKGIVKKERMLYMVGQTRVHCDRVQGLGDFMELEVCMTDGQSVEEGQTIADKLMVELGIQQKDLLSGAYMDMILKNAGTLKQA